jgi:hypothetical protein
MYDTCLRGIILHLSLADAYDLAQPMAAGTERFQRKEPT